MSKDRNNIVDVTRQSPPVDTTEPYDAAWVAGKTILVTGGASGFGEGFFRKWAENGANVIIGDVDAVRGKALVEDVRSTTGSQNHHYIHCDVTNWQSQVDFFREAIRLSPHGGIDAVVANAGIADIPPWFDEPPANIGTLEEPPAPPLKCLQVNLIGVMYTAHLAYFHLPSNPQSKPADHTAAAGSSPRDRHLLLIGSLASITPLPMQIEYCTAKHAVLGLFRSLRGTAFIKGIRINMIMPYYIDTPMIPAAGRVLLAGGAMGKPEDVVDAATRLMADTKIVGRSLVVGPRMRVNDDWQLIPHDAPGGKEAAVWEAYADDFEQVEVFVSRFVRVLNQIERARGWLGWTTDMLLAALYPLRNWWGR